MKPRHAVVVAAVVALTLTIGGVAVTGDDGQTRLTNQGKLAA